MQIDDGVALTFRAIYESGLQLKVDIERHLDSWPVRVPGSQRPLKDGDLPHEFATAVEALRDRAHRWFNVVTVNVLPHTAHHREYMANLLREVSAAIGAQKYYVEYRPAGNPRAASFMFMNPQAEFNVELDVTIDTAKSEAEQALNQALRVVRTAHVDTSRGALNPAQTEDVPNTAFIIMWMDPSRPQLEDVHLIVKETFAEFAIAATRADDVQHQDRITDVVLQNIARAEFLFADLSGERPNVYYEVGYAHALGKRPILFRQEGTALHFDLSVHNVPEYRGITDLRQKLRERLSAVTGRNPQSRIVG